MFIRDDNYWFLSSNLTLLSVSSKEAIKSSKDNPSVRQTKKNCKNLENFILNICNPVYRNGEFKQQCRNEKSLNPNMSVLSDSVIILEIVQGSGYCRVAKCLECKLIQRYLFWSYSFFSECWLDLNQRP